MKRIFRCTGCHQTIKPGPYLRKRIKKHLAEVYHNHDAIETIYE